MKERLGAFALMTFLVEHAEYKLLDSEKVMRVTLEIVEIVCYRNFADLLLQKVRFVEKQNDGNVEKVFIFDNCFEDAHGFDEPIGLSILHQHLVIFTGRYEEQDGRHAVKALKPLCALRPLATDVYKLEGDLLYDRVILHNALGGLPGL